MGDFRTRAGHYARQTRAQNKPTIPVLAAKSSQADIDDLLNEKDWFEIILVDDYDQPIPYEHYRLTTSDGVIIEGFLGEDGVARIENIASGICDVVFLNVKRDS